jgi:hypothetical protein
MICWKAWSGDWRRVSVDIPHDRAMKLSRDHHRDSRQQPEVGKLGRVLTKRSTPAFNFCLRSARSFQMRASVACCDVSCRLFMRYVCFFKPAAHASGPVSGA